MVQKYKYVLKNAKKLSAFLQVMIFLAIFGYLYYDKDVLELVPSSDDENSADIQLGTGWSIGNLSLGNTTAEENGTEEIKQFSSEKRNRS